MQLSSSDQAKLDGRHGPAVQLAMQIVVRMAQVYGANELLDITSAHIDSTIYIGEAGLEFAERLAGLGARVVVPTTLNVSGLDEHGYTEWPVPAGWAANARRQMLAYQSMIGDRDDSAATWTCAPYQVTPKPALGQQIAWGESNAIVFANSVCGARTERYPDLLDICCAITGRAPAAGLHLTENRAGEILVQLVDIPPEVQSDDTFYPVLGHLLGKLAGDRIPVVAGLSVEPGEDQLKALGAAASSSGAVALFHLVGVTPEAPTLEAAFRGRAPQQTVQVGMADLRANRRELSMAGEGHLDMVVLGSPHFSLGEFRQLDALLKQALAADQHCHPHVRFLITSSRMMTTLARRAGLLAAFEAFGGKVTVDTCILATPMLPSEVKNLMTNSAKYAYYAPGMLGARVVFGSLNACVRSAIAGRIVHEGGIWAE